MNARRTKIIYTRVETNYTQTFLNKVGDSASLRFVTAPRNCAVESSFKDPRASQTSECNELLDPARARYLIHAQRQPGKLTKEELTNLGEVGKGNKQKRQSSKKFQRKTKPVKQATV